jgi:hypothetical protein
MGDCDAFCWQGGLFSTSDRAQEILNMSGNFFSVPKILKQNLYACCN